MFLESLVKSTEPTLFMWFIALAIIETPFASSFIGVAFILDKPISSFSMFATSFSKALLAVVAFALIFISNESILLGI